MHTQLNHNVDMPSDAQRIQRVKLLADNGYADRVVIAQDMHSKHRLVSPLVHTYSAVWSQLVKSEEKLSWFKVLSSTL